MNLRYAPHSFFSNPKPKPATHALLGSGSASPQVAHLKLEKKSTNLMTNLNLNLNKVINIDPIFEISTPLTQNIPASVD